MALRVAAEVEAELDEIWLYIATESGDFDVADRLVNSITDSLRFPGIRIWDAAAINRLEPT
jgi:hypothetical protein